VPPASGFAVDVEGLWQRSRPATVAGAQVRSLCPEELLLHLCMHISFQHRFSAGLLPLCDIAETLRRFRQALDWGQLRERAVEWRAARCLYLSLRLAVDLLGAEVPDGVLPTLEPEGWDPAFAVQASEQIVTVDEEPLPMTHDLARVWGAGGLQKQAATLLQVAFPSPEILSRVYPASPSSWRIYLYYPVHLAHLLSRYGRTAWRLLRRDEEMVAAAERRERMNALREWIRG